MTSATSPKGILIEGVECAGKSTLIKEIRDNVAPWDAKYLAHQPGHQFDRFMYEYMINNRIIFNRGHFSESVYSRLWDRESPFSPSEVDVLNDYTRRNLVVVLCDADVDTLVERYNQRDFHQKASAEELSRIRDLFAEEFDGIDCIHYSSTDEAALKQVSDQIKSLINPA